MTTLRSILMYLAAVVVGLFIVAWILGLFGTLMAAVQLGQRTLTVAISGGCMVFAQISIPAEPTISWFPRSGPLTLKEVTGDFAVKNRREVQTLPTGRLITITTSGVHVPLSAMLTALLPIVVGCFTTFRFRLWHYLAYMALVAVELAYYSQG